MAKQEPSHLADLPNIGITASTLMRSAQSQRKYLVRTKMPAPSHNCSTTS